MTTPPRLYGVYLFVRDMPRTLDFYRRLGLTVVEMSPVFARADLPGGSCIEFGTAQLTRGYDPNWIGHDGVATNTINLEFTSHEAVDAVYQQLIDAGHRGRLAPIDAPWFSRFALLDDPDGNIVGLHGPRTRDHEP